MYMLLRVSISAKGRFCYKENQPHGLTAGMRLEELGLENFNSYQSQNERFPESCTTILLKKINPSQIEKLDIIHTIHRLARMGSLETKKMAKKLHMKYFKYKYELRKQLGELAQEIPLIL